MQYVAMIKNDPITGVRYGLVDFPPYIITTHNEHLIQRHNRLRDKTLRMTHTQYKTKQK